MLQSTNKRIVYVKDRINGKKREIRGILLLEDDHGSNAGSILPTCSLLTTVGLRGNMLPSSRRIYGVIRDLGQEREKIKAIEATLCSSQSSAQHFRVHDRTHAFLSRKSADGLDTADENSDREDDYDFDTTIAYDISFKPWALFIVYYAVFSVVHIIPSSAIRPSATSFVAKVNNSLARV